MTGRAPWPYADPAAEGARGGPLAPSGAATLLWTDNPCWWRADAGRGQGRLPYEFGKRTGAGAGSESEIRV